jgi:hypothetical protein
VAKDPPLLPFERFVTAVHRRMTVLRAAERVGVATLGGCAVAVVLMPILIRRGEPTDGLAAAALGGAAIVGMFWGVLSRPSRLAAAAEADRHLRLADLLGTALALRQGGRSPDDEMARAVLALADVQCGRASPAAVVLHRLGARGWGGIGLAVALVLGVNLLAPDAARSAQRLAGTDPAASWLDTDPDADAASSAAPTPRAPDRRRAQVGGGADDPDPARGGATDAAPTATAGGTPVEAADNGSSGGGADGVGGGASQSPPTSPAPVPGVAASGQGPVDPIHGTASGGGGRAGSESAGRPSGTAGGTSGGNGGGQRRPAPVWQSEGWASDREAAGAAIRDGRIPDAYRDLVRSYFERD